MRNAWGYIVDVDEAWTHPLLVSEIGTCHEDSCIASDAANPVVSVAKGSKISKHSGFPLNVLPNGQWFQYLMSYMLEIDVDFAVWAWNGSTCKGSG